jgi:uncharacterized damage-inducible protein DinB
MCGSPTRAAHAFNGGRMRENLVINALAGYAPAVGEALWRLEDARERTLRLLADLPDDYVDRETQGNTIGTILYHLALIEADWLFAEILEEPVSDELNALFPADHRDLAGILTFVRGQTIGQHLDRLRAVRATLLARLHGMTAEDYHRVRTLPQYDVSPAWVLHHLAQHEAEHRGELGSIISQFRAES